MIVLFIDEILQWIETNNTYFSEDRSFIYRVFKLLHLFNWIEIIDCIFFSCISHLIFSDPLFLLSYTTARAPFYSYSSFRSRNYVCSDLKASSKAAQQPWLFDTYVITMGDRRINGSKLDRPIYSCILVHGSTRRNEEWRKMLACRACRTSCRLRD